MKKIKIIPVIFLAFIFLVPLYKAKSEDNEYKINSKFENSNFKPNTVILDYKYEDINGDNIKDDVILIGNKEDKRSSWSNKISLIIKYGKEKKYHNISIGKIDYGYNGRLFLGDFNGDKISDVFISLDSQQNNRFYSLISFKGNKTKYLFNQEKFSLGIDFDIYYKDFFKVNILDKKYNSMFIEDMTSKKNIYIKEMIYNSEGKILKETKGFQEGFAELKPVDIDKDGIYELEGKQMLNGICAQDNIGCAKSLWKYNKSKMELMYLYVIPYDKIEINNYNQSVLPVIKIK